MYKMTIHIENCCVEMCNDEKLLTYCSDTCNCEQMIIHLETIDIELQVSNKKEQQEPCKLIEQEKMMKS